MNPRELIRETASRFRTVCVPDPVNDAAMLLSHLTGRPPLALRLDDTCDLGPAVLSAYEHLVQQRLKRIPLQYLLGEVSFFRRIFHVDPRVLIPRSETELLCEWALEVLSDTASPRVLDLCCGSGCIGLTLKAERPDAHVTLSDISADALEVASLNASRLDLDVHFRHSDLLAGFTPGAFDLIVSNPPYVCSEDCEHLQAELLYEPMLALHGGDDGCDLHRRIIEEAGSVLLPGGMLLMEMGIRQSDILRRSLLHHGFSDIRIRKDLAGTDRLILAVHS